MARTVYYISVEGTPIGDGSLGDPMILGGSSLNTVLSGATFASDAIVLAFLPGVHTQSGALTPTGTPTLDNTFELIAVDASGVELPTPAHKYGPASDWTSDETNTARRAQINVNAALLASAKPNIRISGLSFAVNWAASNYTFDLGDNSTVSQCRFAVNASLTNGTPRGLFALKNDNTCDGCVFCFAAAATDFAAALYLNGGGTDVTSCYFQGPSNSTGSGTRYAIYSLGAGQRPVIEGCVIYNFAGAGISVAGANLTPSMIRNTIVQIGGAGITCDTIPTFPIAIMRNHITDCGGYGVAITASSVGIDVIGPNRMRNNTSGNIQTANMGDRTPLGTLITDAGSMSSDFVDAQAGDFRLSANNPAVGLGVGAGEAGGTGAGLRGRGRDDGMIEGSFQRKLLATNKTTSVSVANGRALKATLSALPIVWLGSGRKRARGATFYPFGAGSNDQTLTGTLAIVRQAGSGDGDGLGLDDFNVAVLGTVTMTLSTATGVSGGAVLGTSDRLVDTIVLTKSAACLALETMYGAKVTVNSPADNTQAFIGIPDAFGAIAVILDMAPGTATSANALVEVGT